MTIRETSRPLLTVGQVAERLGVSAKTVRRHIADGSFPAVQLGPRWSPVRVPETELERWLNERAA